MNILLGLLLIVVQDTCREKYISEIINHQSEDYYLVVKAKSNGEKVDIILTNIDLFKYFESEGLQIDRPNLISKILNNDVILSIDSTTRKYWTVAKKDKRIHKIRKRGIKYFLDYYFDEYGYIRNERRKHVSDYLIQILFEWNILVGYADGQLYTVRKQYCKSI